MMFRLGQRSTQLALYSRCKYLAASSFRNRIGIQSVRPFSDMADSGSSCTPSSIKKECLNLNYFQTANEIKLMPYLKGTSRDTRHVLASLKELSERDAKVKYLNEVAKEANASSLFIRLPYELNAEIVAIAKQTQNLDQLTTFSPVFQILQPETCREGNIRNLLMAEMKMLQSEIKREIHWDSLQAIVQRSRRLFELAHDTNVLLPCGQSQQIAEFVLSNTHNKAEFVHFFNVAASSGITFESLAPPVASRVLNLIREEAKYRTISSSLEHNKEMGNSKMSSKSDLTCTGTSSVSVSSHLDETSARKLLSALGKMKMSPLLYDIKQDLLVFIKRILLSMCINIPKECNQGIRSNHFFIMDASLRAEIESNMRTSGSLSRAILRLGLTSSDFSPQTSRLYFNTQANLLPFMHPSRALALVFRLSGMGFTWQTLPARLRQSILDIYAFHLDNTIEDADQYCQMMRSLINLKPTPPKNSPTSSSNTCPLTRSIFEFIAAHESVFVNTSKRKGPLITSISVLSQLRVQWNDIPVEVEKVLLEGILVAKPSLLAKEIKILNFRLNSMNFDKIILKDNATSNEILQGSDIVDSVAVLNAANPESVLSCTIEENSKKDVKDSTILTRTTPIVPSQLPLPKSPVSTLALLQSILKLGGKWNKMNLETQTAILDGILMLPPQSLLVDETTAEALSQQMVQLQALKLQLDSWNTLFAIGFNHTHANQHFETHPVHLNAVNTWLLRSLQEIHTTNSLLEKQNAQNLHTAKIYSDLKSDLVEFYQQVLFVSSKKLLAHNVPTLIQERPIIDELFSNFFSTGLLYGSALTSVLRSLAMLGWKYAWFEILPEVKSMLLDKILHVTFTDELAATLPTESLTNLKQTVNQVEILAEMGFPLPISSIVAKELEAFKLPSEQDVLWINATYKRLPKLLIEQSAMIAGANASGPSLSGLWKMVNLKLTKQCSNAINDLSTKTSREKSDRNDSNEFDLAKIEISALLDSLLLMASNTPILPANCNTATFFDDMDVRQRTVYQRYENALASLLLMSHLRVPWQLEENVFASISTGKLNELCTICFCLPTPHWLLALNLAAKVHRTIAWKSLTQEIRIQVANSIFSIPSTYNENGDNAANKNHLFSSPIEENFAHIAHMLVEMECLIGGIATPIRKQLKVITEDPVALRRVLLNHSTDQPDVVPFAHSILNISSPHLLYSLGRMNYTLEVLQLPVVEVQNLLMDKLMDLNTEQLLTLLDGLARLHVSWEQFLPEFASKIQSAMESKISHAERPHQVSKTCHLFSTMIFDLPWDSFSLPDEGAEPTDTSQQLMYFAYKTARCLVERLRDLHEELLNTKDTLTSTLFVTLETFLPAPVVKNLYKEVFPSGKRPVYLHPMILDQLQHLPKRFDFQEISEIGSPWDSCENIMDSSSTSNIDTSVQLTWLSTSLRPSAEQERFAELLARKLLFIKNMLPEEVSPSSSQSRLLVKSNYVGMEYFYPFDVAVLQRRPKTSTNDSNLTEMEEVPIAFIDVGRTKKHGHEYIVDQRRNDLTITGRRYRLKNALYQKCFPGVPQYFLSITTERASDSAEVIAYRVLTKT